MNTKNLSRITIDIPKEDHQKFKILAASLGKTMRELVVESIQEHLRRTKLPILEDMKKQDFENGRD